MSAIVFTAEWLRQRLRDLQLNPGTPLCVAFSGGIDSTALLLALSALPRRERPHLRALHVDHGLRPDAPLWAAQAIAVATELGVACQVLRVQVPREGQSLEAAARTARYAALAQALQPGEVLLSAHHQDDQLETLLLMLMRGAGVSGLSAMAERAPFAGNQLLRPLLPVARAALERYVQERGVRWSEDDSNADTRFDRNFLRQHVTPWLRQRWPAAAATASRSAALLAEAQGLLDESAQRLYGEAADGATLRVVALRALRPSARANLVRYWLRHLGLPALELRRLRELCGPMLEARSDAQPELRWEGAELHRFDGRLFAFAPLPELPQQPVTWRWRQRQISLPGVGTLELRRDPHGNLDLRRLPPRLELRFRVGGERLNTVAGRQTLKEWLRVQRLPPWERTRLPLIYADGTLIAVADRWLSPAVTAASAGGDVGAAGDKQRARLLWRWQLNAGS